MPIIKTDIKNCTECHRFIYTIDKGAYCQEVGFEKMIKNKTYQKFNSNFQNGKDVIPSWCPLLVK